MRVVQVNTADIIGGAALAAYRLHEGLRKSPGIEPAMLVGIKKTNDADIHPVYAGKAGYLLSRLAHVTLRKLGLGSLFRFPPAPNAELLLREANLLHLHHVHGGFFSYPALMRHARQVPTVWTLHDMWSFTGGCAYAMDCLRWQDKCGLCPQASELDVLMDTTAAHANWKGRAYRPARLTIVTPSRWLADLAGASPLHRQFSIRCIPNGIDTDKFRPSDRDALRRQWGVPLDAPVALAQVGMRKGEHLLPRIMSLLPDSVRSRMVLLLVGGEPTPEASGGLGVNRLIVVGKIGEQERMAQLYGLSDVFLHPTLADNLPNTLIESLACGTPAVTFDVGGCCEIVRQGETGYGARALDRGDFARGIASILEATSSSPVMRIRCREVAENEYGIGLMIRRYLELYLELAGGLNGHGRD